MMLISVESTNSTVILMKEAGRLPKCASAIHNGPPRFLEHRGQAAFALTWELYLELPVIDPAGEMLPLVLESCNIHALNVTNVVNCLDKERTVFSKKKSGLIDRYWFLPRRLNRTIFKILETSEHELLTVEGLMGPEDEFKATVERMGLKGLIFDKIWSEADSAE